MKTIAFYNIKGGVGKTATSVNIGHLAASSGRKTLLCDLDPQGSASFYFRTKASRSFSAKKLFKGGKSFVSNIKGSDFDNLDILPAKLSFRKSDIVLDTMKKSREVLKGILDSVEYEIVVLDCPPNVTLLSENVFFAADIIAIPVIPSTLSVLSYEKFLKFYIKSGFDEKRVIAFFSMFEKRKSLHRSIVEQMLCANSHFADIQIPFSSCVEKMGLFRMPVTASLSQSTAKSAYISLWNEIGKRL